jgi:3-hydroxybutyrate dehydrogenase
MGEDGLKGKVVLITGAASGIGFEIAIQFAVLGAHVMLTDLNESLAREKAAGLVAKGYKVTGVGYDVTKEDDLKSVIELALKKHGRLDVLINNAGLQYVSLIEDFPTERFEQMIRVMLTAPFIAIKHVMPVMKKQRSGRIINMASINGLIGFAGKAAYNSAKHGLIGLTKVAALEGAEWGITVNAICPGYVDTPLVRGQFADLAKLRNTTPEKIIEEVIFPLVPQKRLISTGEIAQCAIFLTTDAARGLTGQSIVIDGGYTAQ